MSTKQKTESIVTDHPVKPPYEPPQVLHVFQLEALAVVCTDTNAKNDVGLGCNPGALFS